MEAPNKAGIVASTPLVGAGAGDSVAKATLMVVAAAMRTAQVNIFLSMAIFVIGEMSRKKILFTQKNSFCLLLIVQS
ncbi:unnamed protein product [Camellia sinensis]